MGELSHDLAEELKNLPSIFNALKSTNRSIASLAPLTRAADEYYRMNHAAAASMQMVESQRIGVEKLQQSQAITEKLAQLSQVVAESVAATKLDQLCEDL